MSKESDQLVKNAIASIRKELKPEDLEKIGIHLKVIEREFSDVFEDVGDFLSESMTRKNALKTKDREIEQLKDDLEKSKTNTNLDKIKTENETLKTQVANLKKFKDDADKSRRDSFLLLYDKCKDHADFNKVKPSLKIPELKDEKVDWESLVSEEIASNLAELEKAKNYGSFADIAIPKMGESKVIPKTEVAKDPFDKFPGPK